MALIDSLGRAVDLRGPIAGLFENVKSMSGDTRRLEVHAAHLEAIDERMDRIVELMERMVSSIDQLSATVEELRTSIEPVGRLANRFPGGAKR
jgi:methyl-accepting chemotaxis protein